MSELTTKEDRLKFFAKKYYKSVINLGRESGFHNLNTYTMPDRNNMTASNLEKLWNAGMSIDWYLSGAGEMLSNSKKGQQLKAEQELLEYKKNRYIKHVSETSELYEKDDEVEVLKSKLLEILLK